jgi:circadian clock protein KaiC
MTAVITGERGEQSLTRYGLEEYVADCVILLDHRVNDQISTRRLRIVKYRGSPHGTNEYPFLIGNHGMSVMPITSLGLDHDAPNERVSTGIARLDEMLGGKGVFRGSSLLITGTPGTGKSSVATSFAAAACKRGERALFFSYEESAKQLVRNMRSIGLDLGPYQKKGLLNIHSSRPTLQGLEQHLVAMHDEIIKFKPSVVVVDPISNLTNEDHEGEVKPTLLRLIDLLKTKGITALFTSLTSGKGEQSIETSEVGVSSLMDTWLLLRNIEYNGERNRTIFVLKSRGMNHSNQVREFVISGKGIDLVEVYLGSDRVLTGTARVAREDQERAAARLRQKDHERRLRDLASKQRSIAAQIESLKAEAASEKEEVDFLIAQENLEAESAASISERMLAMRGGTLGRRASSKTRK